MQNDYDSGAEDRLTTLNLRDELQRCQKQCRDHQHKVLQAIGELAAQCKAVEKTLADLTKMVRDGNGQPPLLQRLTVLEQVTKQQDGDIIELRKHYNSAAYAHVVTRGQVIAGFSGVVITALLSLISLCVVLLR